MSYTRQSRDQLLAVHKQREPVSCWSRAPLHQQHKTLQHQTLRALQGRTAPVTAPRMRQTAGSSIARQCLRRLSAVVGDSGAHRLARRRDPPRLTLNYWNDQGCAVIASKGSSTAKAVTRPNLPGQGFGLALLGSACMAAPGRVGTSGSRFTSSARLSRSGGVHQQRRPCWPSSCRAGQHRQQRSACASRLAAAPRGSSTTTQRLRSSRRLGDTAGGAAAQ